MYPINTEIYYICLVITVTLASITITMSMIGLPVSIKSNEKTVLDYVIRHDIICRYFQIEL